MSESAEVSPIAARKLQRSDAFPLVARGKVVVLCVCRSRGRSMRIMGHHAQQGPIVANLDGKMTTCAELDEPLEFNKSAAVNF